MSIMKLGFEDDGRWRSGNQYWFLVLGRRMGIMKEKDGKIEREGRRVMGDSYRKRWGRRR